MFDSNFRVEKFDPLTASEEILDEVLNSYEEFFKEINPDDPLPSREFGKSLCETLILILVITGGISIGMVRFSFSINGF